jgi:serine/threonine-protein kinase RsbW
LVAVPLSALSHSEFKNREAELEFLMRLADTSDDRVPPNVLLVGRRGSGKTELVRQAHRAFFWEDGPVPFYYRFRTATLKSRHFAKDYFSRFVRQFIACVVKDPSLANNMSIPLGRLAARVPHASYACISELIEDINEQLEGEELPGQMLAAISAPAALARCAGKRLVIILDDFQLARHVYESAPGDTPGVVSVFEESMRSPGCPHIITGSPESALDAIFSDDSLIGRTERLRLGPLPADAALSLFEDVCLKLGALSVEPECSPLMRHLCGNPLYIRNVARAAGRTGAKQVSAPAFTGCYAREVTEGDTFSYLSSVMGRGMNGARQKSLALEVLSRLYESPHASLDPGRLSRQFGTGKSEVEAVMAALGEAGMLPDWSKGPADPVVEDFVAGARIIASGSGAKQAREHVINRRFGRDAVRPLSFEMVIPKASDAELVAAKAVEQICTGVELGKDEAQQLSSAIIEACINAMEHSGGYDDRVFLNCSVYPGRIEVAVESEGRPIDPADVAKAREMPGLDSKRGRGFSLMGRFVDDIRVERSGDRTRVVLVKRIDRAKDKT